MMSFIERITTRPSVTRVFDAARSKTFWHDAFVQWGVTAGLLVLFVLLFSFGEALWAHHERFAGAKLWHYTLEYRLLPVGPLALLLGALVLGAGLLSSLLGTIGTNPRLRAMLSVVPVPLLVYVTMVFALREPDPQVLLFGRPIVRWWPGELWPGVACLGIALLVWLGAAALWRARVALALWRTRVFRIAASLAVLAMLFAYGAAVWWPLQVDLDASSRPNVILISMDTLRADHLGCYGYLRDTSPTIDQWASQGVLFENAISQAPWTVPAHLSLFSGLYPRDHGLTHFSMKRHEWQRARDDIPLLAEHMSAAGYVSAAYTGAAFMGPAFGFARGFDQYWAKHSRLERFQPRVSRWLERNARWPFFLFLHFYNCHRPYKPPPPYDRQFVDDPAPQLDEVRGFCKRAEQSGEIPSQEAIQRIIAQYDGEIAYADHLLADVSAAIDELGLRENTLLVFLSDHGDAFFEHGNCDHLKSLYEPLVRVPLIVRGPQIAKGRRVPEVVELRALPQWILNYVGIEASIGSPVRSLEALVGDNEFPSRLAKPGSALTSTNNKGYEIREGVWIHHQSKQEIIAARSSAYKLVASGEGEPEEFYDLRDDPGEQYNLLTKGGLRHRLHDASRVGAGPEPAESRRALEQLSAEIQNYLQQSPHARGSAATPAQVDDATVEELRELGYID